MIKIASEHLRTYPDTKKRLERMARQHDVKVPEILERLSKTGDPTDPKQKTEEPKSKRLKAAQSGIALKLGSDHNPAEYFKSDTGLYVWDNFSERVLRTATLIKKGSTFKLRSYDLVESSTDQQIEQALPPKHLFTNSEVCAIIASLIAKQKKGENGALLITGYANLFYTEQCVVYVYWSGDGWFVFAWQRFGNGWRADGRVFSPGN